MDKKVVAALTKEMPVIERIINAYLTRQPNLAGVVVNGVRFGDSEPIASRANMEELSTFFDGDSDKAALFAAKTNEVFGFGTSGGTAGPYKPCKDDRGNTFYIPINQNCP